MFCQVYKEGEEIEKNKSEEKKRNETSKTEEFQVLNIYLLIVKQNQRRNPKFLCKPRWLKLFSFML